MSYTPTEWATGDVITAEKLNNMEQGIVNAGNAVVFEFTATYDAQQNGYSITTDVTFEGVKSAFLGGKLCVARIVMGEEDIYNIVLDSKGIYDVSGTMITMSLGGAAGGYLSIHYYRFSGDEFSGWRFSYDKFKVTISNE